MPCIPHQAGAPASGTRGAARFGGRHSVKLRRLIEALRHAQALSGKHPARQLAEAVSLRLGRGALGISEYFEFRLFDDRRFTAAQKRQFVGWRTKRRLHRALDIDALSTFVVDKTTYHTFARGAGLPVPALLGLYSQRARHVPGAPCLRSPEELATFLRSRLAYPAFAKPAVSKWGRGAHILHGLDPTGETLSLEGGATRALGDFVAEVAGKGGGYLFQEALRPHPKIAEISGGRLCCLRIVALNGGARGPRLHRAVWKVATGGNPQDNFHQGETGNLLAKIDLQTGRVESLVGAGWPWPEVRERHPDSGATVAGFVIPDWHEAVALTLEAATAFPGARVQGWDVALTDRGPVLLELNAPADLDIVQLAADAGFWDDEFDAFHREITSRRGPWFESI